MNTIRATRVGQLTFAVLLTLVACAQASRLHRPMGDYVREADLIVIGNTRKSGERGFNIGVSVTEVIKGDSTAVGAEIVLNMMAMSTAHAYVPVPATNVVVLLRTDWRKQKKWPVLEAYKTAKEADAVRTLVGIYRHPGERERLLALRKKALAGNSYYLVQLLHDLRNMTEPKNFDVMVDFYDALAPVNQAKLVTIMARTGDIRAVPPLLKAMQSSDKGVSGTAARSLAYTFPGAPGVTDAFEKALKKEHLARQAACYLSLRRDDPALAEIGKGRTTSFAQAGRLWKEGDMNAARAAYLAIVENSKESDYVRRAAATKLLPDASVTDKERIRKALLPLLLAAARGDNYIFAKDATSILRELCHVDCLDTLQAVALRQDFVYWPGARTAVLAIRELGKESRQQAFARFVKDLESDKARMLNTRKRTNYMLTLIWLGDRESLAKATNVLPASWQSTWTSFGPLRSAANNEDEGLSLARILEKPGSLSQSALQWTAFRLGDLKEIRAAKGLIAALTRAPNSPLAWEAKDALICIGGSETENEMLKLLSNQEPEGVARAATEILFRLQGERACDLARRMLREDGFGVKMSAMTHLMNHGTLADVTLLLPYCDYWKADRTTHYWAMQAVGGIRSRYNYDINGLIVKHSDKK
jgi:HEAT repeat protein